MFLIWAIPLIISLLLFVWLVFGLIRRRVRTGDREEGRVISEQ